MSPIATLATGVQQRTEELETGDTGLGLVADGVRNTT